MRPQPLAGDKLHQLHNATLVAVQPAPSGWPLRMVSEPALTIGCVRLRMIRRHSAWSRPRRTPVVAAVRSGLVMPLAGPCPTGYLHRAGFGGATAAATGLGPGQESGAGVRRGQSPQNAKVLGVRCRGSRNAAAPPCAESEVWVTWPSSCSAHAELHACMQSISAA
jgi:hypothetical protein